MACRSTVPDFASTVVDVSGVANTFYTLTSSLSANTLYYWHVNASGCGNISNYSGAWQFTTDVPVTYDRANGGLFWASEKTSLHTGPTDAGTIADAADYTNISTSDNSRWTTTGAGGSAGDDTQWDSQMYKFNISNVANIKWFEINWEGYGEQYAGHPIALQVWNYSAGGWEWVDKQEGYDTQDRVLGNRRYELPNANISYYVNRSATPNEMTVRAAGSHNIPSAGCPKIYAWNGETYKFVDAATLGKIYARLSGTTYEATTNVVPRDGYYDLAVYMPTLENGYIDNLGLQVVDHPAGTEVITDASGTVHTISDPQPVTAVDSTGKDVTALLANEDGVYWNPVINGRDLNDSSQLDDWVEITLPDAPKEGVAKLVVSAPEAAMLGDLECWYFTEYNLGSPNHNELLERVNSWAGYENGSFAANADKTLLECTDFQIQVWNGSEWVCQTRIPVLGYKGHDIALIDLSQVTDGKIRIQIPVGFYKIDWVAVDYTEDADVTITELPLAGATEYFCNDSGIGFYATKDVRSEVTAEDGSFALMCVGDYILYSFRALDEPAQGMVRSFVIPTGGYYDRYGPEVAEDKSYNWDLMEELMREPYAFRQLIYPMYINSSAPVHEYTWDYVQCEPPILNGDAIVTDYVKVVTHTCTRPDPTFTVDGRKGNWYLWKCYYDDQGKNGYINLTYWFETLDRTGDTIYFQTTLDSGSMSYQVNNSIHGDWHLPYSTTARLRTVAAPSIGSSPNYMLDSEVYVQPWGSEIYNKIWAFPIIPPPGTMGSNGVAPAAQYYTPNGNNNWNAADYGAPWTTGESFSLVENIHADPTELGGDQWLTDTVQWTNQSYITGYNVSNSSSVCPGTGKFGSINNGTQLFDASQIRAVYTVLPAANNGNTTAEALWWYNSSVENWVRKYDSMRYFGYEDNAIIAYESENFRRSDLVVANTSAGKNLSVSLNITNDTGVAQKFNALLCVMDYDIVSPNAETTKLLFDGATVYPNVASNTSTWPYYDAIKTTATLANGATEKVTWNTNYTLVSGHAYWIWCSGMIYGPWTAR